MRLPNGISLSSGLSRRQRDRPRHGKMCRRNRIRYKSVSTHQCSFISSDSHNYYHNVHRIPKNFAIFLSEHRNIFTNFHNLWQTDNTKMAGRFSIFLYVQKITWWFSIRVITFKWSFLSKMLTQPHIVRGTSTTYGLRRKGLTSMIAILFFFRTPTRRLRQTMHV